MYDIERKQRRHVALAGFLDVCIWLQESERGLTVDWPIKRAVIQDLYHGYYGLQIEELSCISGRCIATGHPAPCSSGYQGLI
jgi:hypothetical protein